MHLQTQTSSKYVRILPTVNGVLLIFVDLEFRLVGVCIINSSYSKKYENLKQLLCNILELKSVGFFNFLGFRTSKVKNVCNLAKARLLQVTLTET